MGAISLNPFTPSIPILSISSVPTSVTDAGNITADVDFITETDTSSNPTTVSMYSVSELPALIPIVADTVITITADNFDIHCISSLRY